MTQLQDKLDDLLELQNVDTQMARLKRGQAALDNGKEAEAAARAAREIATKQNQEFHRLSGELKDSELKLQSLEAKLKTNQQRLYQGTVSNPKELVNIEKEISNLQRQRSDLDERILELMDEVDVQKSVAASTEAEAKVAETHHKSTVADWRTKFEAAAQELATLGQRRPLIVAAITDKSLLKRYEDLRARPGGIGLAKINGSNCSACGMSLPSNTIKSVREGEELTSCENCGRLLTLA